MRFLDPHPLLYHTARFSLHTHGLFFAIGAVVGIILWMRQLRQVGQSTDLIPLWGLLIFAAGLLAARVGYFLSYPSQFTTVADLLAFWQGGLVSYFGLVGGAFAAYLLFSRQPALSPAGWFDLLAGPVLIAWSIGRLGNYYAGDSVGVLWPHVPYFYGRVPIQLIEGVFDLVIGVIAVRLAFRLRPGQTVLAATAAYLLGRLVIDHWRDEGYLLLGLHVSQVVSLVGLLFLLVFMMIRQGRLRERV